MRAPLLGIYALLAEWQALLNPATEHSVAQLKLAWWHEEMSRLVDGAAVHPISLYLAEQPSASGSHFKLLMAAVQAAMIEISGVPLELGSQLEEHSDALIAGPLRVASLIAAGQTSEAALLHCTRALAIAQWLARALQEYRREARCGRVPFPVDELLNSGVENADLLAQEPPPRLQTYLDDRRRRADQYFAEVALEARADAAPLRHLMVLAAIGRKHLSSAGSHSGLGALKDMLIAWKTARRAAS